MTRGELRRKLAGLARVLRDESHTRGDAFVRVADRAIHSAGLTGWASVARCSVVELTKAPPKPRGLSDLVVRQATLADLGGLCEVDATGRALVRARLARGDLAYVGMLDDYVLCHTWMHRGPTPFDEDRDVFARWGLDERSYWSYHGVARPEARSSGAWVKVFQSALRDLLGAQGAARVRGFIHRSNAASLAVHRRLGFEVVEDVTAVAVRGAKWVRWERGDRVRHFVVRQGAEITLPPGTERA